MINLLISDPYWALLVLWVHVQILASGLFIGTVLKHKLRQQRRSAALRKINAWSAPVLVDPPHAALVSFSIEIDFNRAAFYGVRDGNTLHLSSQSAYFATSTTDLPDDYRLEDLIDWM